MTWENLTSEIAEEFSPTFSTWELHGAYEVERRALKYEWTKEWRALESAPPPKLATCSREGCGQVFLGNVRGRPRRYCSDRCNDRVEAYVKCGQEGRCAVCSKTFVHKAQGGRRRTCSKACRQMKWVLTRRAA